MDFKGLDILVLGYGESGKGAVGLLKKMQANVYVYCDEPLDIEDKSVTKTDRLDKDYFFAVASPSFSFAHEAVKRLRMNNIRVIGEIELGYICCPSSIVAVTGTNGKSTVVSLSANLLKRAGVNAISCGNFGIAFSKVASTCGPYDVPIVEVSSFQLEAIENFSPDIAIITNISKDHMDRYSDYEEYIAAKKNIFKNQLPGDILIANYDDEQVRAMANETLSEVFYFSRKEKVNGAYLDNGDIVYTAENKKIRLCNVKDIYSDYPFEIENCLAVITLGGVLNIPSAVILESVRSYQGLPHRMQPAGEYGGKKYYNNSKATNVAGSLASVNAVKDDCLLILGGSSKNEDFNELFAKLPDNVKHIAICGANARVIQNVAVKYNKISEVFSSLEEIIRYSKSLSDIKAVVYAPGSASFDKYSNFEERGLVFCELVKGLN